MPRATTMSHLAIRMPSLVPTPRLDPQLQMAEYQTLNGLTRQLPMRTLRPTPSLCLRIAMEILEATNIFATLMLRQVRWTQRWAYHCILILDVMVKPRLETNPSLGIFKKCSSKSRYMLRRSMETIGARNGERIPTSLLRTQTQRETTATQTMLPYSPMRTTSTTAV